ncbi:MAG: glycosyltransferase [Gemmatimonadota bacterium]|nr:glycosyltransferase [Gemmatimonadota bacterium]MDQ8173246.1 glycosyltransferase [Gemmatimonadota bacterium]
MTISDAAAPGRVSVVIPTHRDRGYIGETIASALRNMAPGDEIIVAANGCTPEYLTWLRASLEARVRLLVLPEAGVSAARNAGADLAAGDLLIMLDDDDLLADGGVATMRALLDDHPEWHAVTGDVELFGDGIPTKWRRHPSDPRALPPAVLLGSSITSPGAAMVRRSAFVQCGGFESRVIPCEDWDLWLKLVLRGPIMTVGTPTLRYRVHAEGVSQNAVRMGSTALRVFLHYLEAVRAISTARACSWSAARLCAWYVPRLRRAVWQSLRTGDILQAWRALVLLARLARLRVALRWRVIGSAVWITGTPSPPTSRY